MQLAADPCQAPAGQLILSHMCLLLMRPTATCCAGAAVLAVSSLCNIAAQGGASPG